MSQNTFRATQLPEVMEENVKCGSLPVQQRGSPAGAEKNLSRFNAGRKNNQPGPLMVKWECVGTPAVGTSLSQCGNGSACTDGCCTGSVPAATSTYC